MNDTTKTIIMLILGFLVIGVNILIYKIVVVGDVDTTKQEEIK